MHLFFHQRLFTFLREVEVHPFSSRLWLVLLSKAFLPRAQRLEWSLGAHWALLSRPGGWALFSGGTGFMRAPDTAKPPVRLSKA